MKKFIIIMFLFFTFTFMFGDDFIISETSTPDSLKGNSYFPLFVGAKWSWAVKGLKNIKNIIWEITSAYLINNKSLNFNNLLAFKIIAPELNEEWYIFENEGFLCYLKEIDGVKKIEKVFPLDPNIENEWMNDNDKYNIASIEDNMIKVEFISENATRYGYLMFIKDIGPYEIFEISTAAENSKDLIMTITDNLTYSEFLESKNSFVKSEGKEDKKEEKANSANNKETIKTEEKITDNKEKENAAVKENKKEEAKIEEKKETEKTTVKEKEANTTEKTKNDILNDKEIPKEILLEALVKNKKYIQIGAYKIIYYAKEKVEIAKNKGFKAKIFKDKDSYYKVLIEYTGDEKEILSKIKKSVESDAYIKQK